MSPILAGMLTVLCATQDADPTQRIMQRIDAELQDYRRKLVGEIRRTILEELERARAGSKPERPEGPRHGLVPETPKPSNTPVLLGISVDEFTDEDRKALKVPGGMKIAGVRGPAKKAGVRAGDILLEIDGDPVTERTIGGTLSRYAPGDAAKLTVLRDGKRQTLKVVFSERQP